MRGTMLTRSTEETNNLMLVAMGKKAADLAIVNANLLNVYTGELLEGYSVCVWDRWIAYVGKNPEGSIGDNTLTIDAEGKTVLPGFIDGHTHNAWLTSPHAFLEYAMAGGTTTIITETLEPYPVAGLAGVIDFLESLKDQPVKFFATAPIMVSTSSAARGIPTRDLQQLLERDDVIGLGESYWQAIIQEPNLYLPTMTETLRARKILEGHTAGASEKNLMAYLVSGVTSCHEPIVPVEVLDRLRLGMHVMIREGGVRRDLVEISNIKDSGADLRRLILVTDSIGPSDLMEFGYMEYVVQKAIDCGFDPVSAVTMATLNPAEHFRLDHLIGGIAPGRYADMVIVPHIRNIRADCVISNGKIIAEGGKLLVSPRTHKYKEGSKESIKLKRKLKPDDFIILAPTGAEKATVRIINMVTDLVTREDISELPVNNGQICLDIKSDIVKVAAVDRTISPGKTFTGLIKGFGIKSGALACSGSWDTTDIVVVGADESDMAFAVNRVVELKGGIVVCYKENIVEDLSLPVFGIISELPLKEIDKKLKAINAAVSGLGVTFPDPILSLITLTGSAIPFLRICEEGLVILKQGKTVGLFV